MTSNLPYIVYGTITESGTGVDSAYVKIRNESTGEIISTTANSSGLFVKDLSEFASGYLDGQLITVYTIYQNFDGESSFTIAIPVYSQTITIALSSVEDSTEIDYCVVQDIYDELDGKTTSDISASRVIKAVQRAEGIIDTKTGTTFTSTTITDEVHEVNRYEIGMSPDSLDTGYSSTPLRSDRMSAGTLNRVKTDNMPVISITSLSRNGAGATEADSWTELTEQTGSSGNYVLADSAAGIIDFLNNFPRFGKRSWKITYNYGYDRDSTVRNIQKILKVVERLTVILASKAVISSKSTGSVFDSPKDIRIGQISLSSAGVSTKAYLSSVDVEINDLWLTLGTLGLEVI